MLDDTTKVMVFMRVWDRMFNPEILSPETVDADITKLVRFTGKVTRQLLVEMEGRFHGSCTWELDKDDLSWNGTCGVKWCFTESGPAVNGMHYCPRCGRFIKEVQHVPST